MIEDDENVANIANIARGERSQRDETERDEIETDEAENPLSVVYLDVQRTLLLHCGEDCPWLGLFHVDVPVRFFSTFISDVRRYLIPKLIEALREFERQGGEAPDLDFDYFLRHYQLHMWASRTKGGQPHDPELAGDATPQVEAETVTGSSGSEPAVCYLVASSTYPVLRSPIWTK